jgi:serine/threonine protein phosphatase PrpC
MQPEDEFLVLGCDGIWDCLSNEDAVHFVRSRIDTMTPAAIGIEMLDKIISVEPRTTQGIGGDNMTILIVDLQPHRRAYRSLSRSDHIPLLTHAAENFLKEVIQ